METRTFRSILSAAGALTVLTSLGVVACSGDDPVEREVPTPAQVRDYFALNDGSCWRYRFQQGAATLFARVEVSGPNMQSVAGETVYVRKFTFESGGLPREWYLDTEADGEIRLLRATSGLDRTSRETRRYEETAPLFGALEFDVQNQFGLEQGDRFTTESTTPELCTGEDQSCAPGPAERHEWTVTSTDEEVTTPDGQEVAVKMNYRVSDDEGSRTEVYSLVPGKGVARFTDEEGTVYQVCAWRVCDSAGACIGAPSCAELDCF